ncbi:MAG TPA: AAA family ATPase, partial [Nanoarchaeota archaeon]|nr:AAA family ATPase [Nanoarchaeota archaeon]
MSKEFLENFYIKTTEKVRNLIIVKRDLDIKIVKEKVISIIGPRRAGKTYFLFQIMKDIIENSLYLDFEDFLVKQSKNLEVLEFILTKNKKFVFLDEIQNLKNWESLVRTLLNQGYKVFITGSSSKLLSKEIATQLRGRSLSYLL